jgi:hypothetical protein
MTNVEGSDLKRFFKKFIILIVALVIIDSVIGEVFKHYYFKQSSGLLYRTTYSINDTRAQYLVFGSSRANHHYASPIFEKKLNATFYNCGRDGSGLMYSSAVISAVIARYNPKHVIIDLNPDELCNLEEGQLAPLLPYYQNPAIRPYLNYNSKFEKYKLLSKMYIYNSLLTNVIVGNLAFNKSRLSDVDGYVPLDKVMDYSKRETYVEGKIINSRINLLNDILDKLNKKHIPVAVVISPLYISFNTDLTASTIEKICQTYGNTKFFNYENDHEYDDYKLYSDSYHLNQFGADKFSNDLCARLAAQN